MQRLGCDMPDKPSVTTDQFSLDIRQALLAMVAAIEREKDISPATAELRREVKRLEQELRELKGQPRID